MTDQAAAPGRAIRGGALGLRLALAFITVALAAVALLAGLTAVFAAADVSTLASQQRTELATAIVSAAGAAWEGNHTWSAADLSPVLDLAARTGAAVQIRDQAGHIVDSSPAFAAAHGPQSSRLRRSQGVPGCGEVSGRRSAVLVADVQDALEGVVLGQVVGGAVLPAAPDHVDPGAGEDAHSVR